MADDFIAVEVKNLAEVQAAIAKFPQQVAGYLQKAGQEVGEDAFNSEGLRKYPPTGPGNAPPVPYYIRGRGTEMAYGNLNNSERYGTQFYVKPYESYGVTLGNRASYASYLGGENQSAAMKRIGWRRLVDVVNEKMSSIVRTYEGWIDKCLADLNLK